MSDLPILRDPSSDPDSDAARLPPVPEFIEELCARYGTRIGRVAPHHVLIIFGDMHHDTTHAWESWAREYLRALDKTKQREIHIYDMRRPGIVPIHTIRAAMRANSEPGARLVRLAIVAPQTGVTAAIQMIVNMTPGAAARFFTNMDEARAWASAQLPQ